MVIAAESQQSDAVVVLHHVRMYTWPSCTESSLYKLEHLGACQYTVCGRADWQTYMRYVWPQSRVHNQHGVDDAGDALRCAMGMSESTATDGHCYRLSINLKRRVPVGYGEQSASK